MARTPCPNSPAFCSGRKSSRPYSSPFRGGPQAILSAPPRRASSVTAPSGAKLETDASHRNDELDRIAALSLTFPPLALLTTAGRMSTHIRPSSLQGSLTAQFTLREFRKAQHSAAEPQPKVAGASILDKMLTFGKNTTSWEERSAMNEFIARHAQGIAGVLSGFDRLVFRGTLRPISYPEGMMGYLSGHSVRLTGFGRHVLQVSERLKQACKAQAKAEGRPVKYLASGAESKEELARGVVERDKIEEGLVCVLSCVETCRTFDVYRNREKRKLELVSRIRKCLFLYQYWMHREFGFLSARIQTWFPFSVQVCLNGREWLARQMDRAGMKYVRQDNCFPWVQDWGPGPKVAGGTAPEELAESAGAAGASVEPGARADLWGLSHELLLDHVSARVGYRRGVSAGASVAAIVPTAGALRDDHAGEHGCAALSGACGAAGWRGAQVVSRRSGDRSEVAGRGPADQAPREWEFGEVVRQGVHGSRKRATGGDHDSASGRVPRVSAERRRSAGKEILAAVAGRGGGPAPPCGDFATSHGALSGCSGGCG